LHQWLIVLQAKKLECAAQPPAALPDMLFMAFSMPLPAAANEEANADVQHQDAAWQLSSSIQHAASPGWVKWVAEQLDAELAGKLFQAAIAHANFNAIKLLDSIKPGLAPASVWAALAQAVQQQDTSTLAQLCSLSSAKTCSADLLVAPLLAAIKAGYREGIDQIIGVSGLLQRLTTAHVSGLLLAMLQLDCCRDDLFRKLIALPAARLLPWDAFEVSFNAVIEHQPWQLFALISSLPAQAAQMAFSHLLAAVQVAVRLQDVEAVQQCLALPAVCNSEPDQLRQLLIAALQLRASAFASVKPLFALCRAPAAQRLSSKMIEDVLEAAFDTRNRIWPVLRRLVPLMCQLPQANHMQLSSVIEWLQLALALPSPFVTAALGSWLEQYAVQPGDGSIRASFGSREAAALLVSALPTGASGSLTSLKELCSLECVKRAADASAVVWVLDSTMALRDDAALRCYQADELLLQLPSAAAIPDCSE
jgi:hypothetical protein